MGKIRTRVTTKGKRWIKGQSSTSNPTSRKFRDIAKKGYFQPNFFDPKKSSSLTTDAIAQHNNDMVMETCQDNSISLYGKNSVYSGTFKTHDTFASDWTCCSNTSFSRILKKFNLNSAHDKEMLAVLAAVTEVIKMNNGNENSTEYFAALMTTLDGMKNVDDNEDPLRAVVSLLRMCIKSVPRAVLQTKFSTVSQTLMFHLTKHVESNDTIILRSLISTIGVLLRAQELAVWNEQSTIVIYDSILSFTTHSKPKIRKAAQQCVCAILRASSIFQDKPDLIHHPMALNTSKFVISILEASPINKGTTTVLHLLALLKEILSTFSKQQLKTCCECILKLLSINHSVTASCCLQALHGLFISKPNSNTCPPTLNAQLINALYDYQPSITDTQLTIAWITVLQEAFVNLARNDSNLCLINLPKFFAICTKTLLCERKETVNSATLTMKELISSCIGPAFESNPINSIEVANRIFEMLKNCMEYRYHEVWKQILYLLTTMYKICGKQCVESMLPFLSTLAQLRDTEHFVHHNELDQVFAAAIRSMGPELIIRQLPIQLVDKGTSHDFNRTWLLPLLKDNIYESTLECFDKCCAPCAVFFKERSVEAHKRNDSSTAKTYEILALQFWALLPSFCDNPTDIEYFTNMAQPLGTVLKGDKNIRSTIMLALRRLINYSQSDNQHQEIMSRYAKNYLPILFNIFVVKPKGTDEEANRFASFDTIKAYLSISDDGLHSNFFEMALKKLDMAEKESNVFLKESVLDLIRALIQYQSEEALHNLFDNYISKIMEKNHFKEEKKYYRLFEDLCASKTVGCTTFIKSRLPDIKKLLLNSLSTAATTSRGPRIRCISHLLSYDDSKDAIFENIPEAVLCCNDGNKRCRASAFELICKMADIMAEKERLREYIGQIMVGFKGSARVMTASILALTTILYHCKDKIEGDIIEQLIRNVCLIATSSTREVAAPAIGFIKLFIGHCDINLVSTYLSLIVKTLSKMTDDCKRKLRQKLRDIYSKLIRKYGHETIVSLVPSGDEIALKRIRCLRKLDEKSKKDRKASRAMRLDKNRDQNIFDAKFKPKTMDEILAECDDDDEDEQEVNKKKEEKVRKTKKSDVYLREDVDTIIDFTDKNLNAMSVKKPVKENSTLEERTKKVNPFKIASDGRLIIEDNDETELQPDNSSDDLDDKLENCSISEDVDEDARSVSSKYKPGGSGIHRKRKNPSDKYSGAEFKSKKSKGDVKRSGKHQPFAYVPLTRNSLNKRKKKKSAGQFTNIIKSATKGASAGRKKNSQIRKKKSLKFA